MSDHGHGHGHGHGAGHRHGPVADLAHGAGADRILFLDAFSGIAGDMLVAALLDLGVPAGVVDRALEALPLDGYHVHLERVTRHAIAALRFDVHVEREQPPRTWREIRALLEGAPLADGARRLALDAFARLADAEAAVHGVALDDVHFHEVGAVDSIVDVVAAAAALDHLGARVVCSPLPMGRGLAKTAHGVVPLPAPATVECLRGAPTYDAGIDFELVTPTGACLVAAAATSFARWPDLRPERVGWGAGSKDLADRPNALRVVLGDDARARTGSEGAFVVVESNVDDASPEIVAVALERLLATGALDAWASPVQMKKSRTGVILSAVPRRADAEAVARTLLGETGSLGARLRAVDRVERPRRIIEVDTRFGRVAVKIADGDGLPPVVAPELESCRARDAGGRDGARGVRRRARRRAQRRDLSPAPRR